MSVAGVVSLYICIDDTDNLESMGTGELASMLAAEVEANGWGGCSSISRHQLLVHPDIPYTSHNSAMCFTADVHDPYIGTLIAHSCAFLAANSAEGSDPGICVAAARELADISPLVEFGMRAKREVLTRQDAYGLAATLGVHLSEHGGTGQGVIGALAGVGLRLGGNDGRLKGRLDIGPEGGVVTVGELLARPDVGIVRSIADGVVLADGERIRIGDKVKTVLSGGVAVLLVDGAEDVDGARWRTCTRRQLKGY